MKLLFLTFLPLAVMVDSDVRSRTVSAGWLLTFCTILWALLIRVYGMGAFLTCALSNLILLGLLGLALCGYFCFRRKKLSEMMGLGDALFLVAVMPFFEMEPFLYYLITTSILALVVWPFFRKVQPHLVGIPFVSVAGFCWSLILVYRIIWGSYGV